MQLCSHLNRQASQPGASTRLSAGALSDVPPRDTQCLSRSVPYLFPRRPGLSCSPLPSTCVNPQCWPRGQLLHAAARPPSRHASPQGPAPPGKQAAPRPDVTGVPLPDFKCKAATACCNEGLQHPPHGDLGKIETLRKHQRGLELSLHQGVRAEQPWQILYPRITEEAVKVYIQGTEMQTPNLVWKMLIPSCGTLSVACLCKEHITSWRGLSTESAPK